MNESANSDAAQVILERVIKNLENSGADVESDVSVIEADRVNLLKIRVKLQREWAEAREKVRLPNYKPDPKDKDAPRYTDFDRTIMNDAAVAETREKYELVKGLEELVRERVDLIKTLLRSQNG